MHWLDTMIVAAIGLGAVLGFVSGLFWQVARIASLVLAVLAAIFWHDAASALLRQWMLRDADAAVVQVSAYGAVFVVVYFSMYVVTRLIRVWLRATDLALPDRALGALVGAGKIALLAAAGCLFLRHASHPAAQDALERSALAPVLARAMEQGMTLVPPEYTRTVLDSFRDLQEAVARSQLKSREN
jgi:uncharacterized membrane protein required for colicin V production